MLYMVGKRSERSRTLFVVALTSSESLACSAGQRMPRHPDEQRAGDGGGGATASTNSVLETRE